MACKREYRFGHGSQGQKTHDRLLLHEKDAQQNTRNKTLACVIGLNAGCMLRSLRS